MSFIVREALSKELYQLFKKGEARFLCQVPFVDKEGNSLPDEDAEYMNITQAVKEMLEAGASPLYYIKDTENFLLPTILNEMRGSSAFSEEVKKEITDLLLNSMNTKELNGLLPTHANMLMKQMLYYDDELNQLFLKGLEFKQDIDNHYADEPMEIAAIRKGQTDFFIKLAQNSVQLDFDLIYQKDNYNETSLRKELERLKTKIEEFKIPESEYDKKYEIMKNENRKETLNLLEKWLLKNKVETLNKSDKIKEGKLKL